MSNLDFKNPHMVLGLFVSVCPSCSVTPGGGRSPRFFSNVVNKVPPQLGKTKNGKHINGKPINGKNKFGKNRKRQKLKTAKTKNGKNKIRQSQYRQKQKCQKIFMGKSL